MNPLVATILHRPYVFAFLAAYLVLAWRRWGWRRTLLWLVTGYAIAWLSEWSSIHNGFPYGEYHYVYDNLRGEFLVAGVPFFDSLSYPFLIFAGFTMADFLLVRWCDGAMVRSIKTDEPTTALSHYRTIAPIFFGALLTMLLDVIIDPIATKGDLWFLGKIHWYAHPGWYFGVPMTNFAGWFLVSLAVIAVNVGLWKLFQREARDQGTGIRERGSGNREDGEHQRRPHDITTSRYHDITTSRPHDLALSRLLHLDRPLQYRDLVLGRRMGARSVKQLPSAHHRPRAVCGHETAPERRHEPRDTRRETRQHTSVSSLTSSLQVTAVLR